MFDLLFFFGGFATAGGIGLILRRPFSGRRRAPGQIIGGALLIAIGVGFFITGAVLSWA
jgi:hypothetical protein